MRVDTYLQEGITAEQVDRWVQTASILHSNGDGMDIAVRDERIVGVRGRAGDRVNHGRPRQLPTAPRRGCRTGCIPERDAMVAVAHPAATGLTA